MQYQEVEVEIRKVGGIKMKDRTKGKGGLGEGWGGERERRRRSRVLRRIGEGKKELGGGISPLQ